MGKTAVRLACLTIGAACALLSGPSVASALTVTVTTGADEYGENADAAHCGLREAVEAANTDGDFGGCVTKTIGGTPGDADFDQVVLPLSAYTLNRDGVDDTNDSGDLDVLNERLDILGQATTGPTTLAGDSDGSGDDRILEIHASAAGTLPPAFQGTGLIFYAGRAGSAGGGAINIAGPAAMGDDLTVVLGLTSFTSNSAAFGGAIENQGGTLKINNSTLSGNAANGNGGGVDTSTAAATSQFENVTISADSADFDGNGSGSGGGVSAQLSGTATFYNTIVAGNNDFSPSGTIAPDCIEIAGGVLDSVNNNLIGSTAGPCGIDVGAGDLQNLSAGLAPLAYIPGAGLSTVLAHDLLPGSPARDAGNPAPPGGPLGTCGTLAQNFGPRPQGPACDIGSVEADFIPPSGSGGGAGSSGAALTAPTGQRAAALKKCKKKRSAAARRKCKRRANLLPV